MARKPPPEAGQPWPHHPPSLGKVIPPDLPSGASTPECQVVYTGVLDPCFKILERSLEVTQTLTFPSVLQGPGASASLEALVSKPSVSSGLRLLEF